MSKVSVLFVCMGNICRSPTAEGVFRHVVTRSGMAERIVIDSAGTHAYHVGEPPDRRAQQAALRRGIDISAQRARKVMLEDFDRFSYLLSMDEENLQHLLTLSEPTHRDKVRLLMEFAPDFGEREVPDPYYGGAAGFERVLDMVEVASEALLAHIRERHFRG